MHQCSCIMCDTPMRKFGTCPPTKINSVMQKKCHYCSIIFAENRHPLTLIIIYVDKNFVEINLRHEIGNKKYII